MDRDALLNSLGVVVMILAVSPAITCFHTVGRGVLMGLRWLAFTTAPWALIALISWITLRYPGLLAREGSSGIVRRYRWLFGKFRPEAYWYGLAFNLRCARVTLTPAIFYGDPLAEASA